MLPNISFYKNNIIIALILCIFQLYSFQNVSFFIDWSIYCLGIEFILLYLIFYKNLSIYILLIPLLIPWIYIFKIFHYTGYLLVLLEIIIFTYLFIHLYKKSKFKPREQWLFLFLITSYCFINNLWAMVLDQTVYWFLTPEKNDYLNILKQLEISYNEKLSLSFFPMVYQSSNQVISSFFIPLFYKALIVKLSILTIWIFFWGILYRLSKLSHQHKIFSLPVGGKLYYSKLDIVLLSINLIYSIYHSWIYGGFTLVGLGIFCNEILILFLFSIWLLVIANLLYDLKIIKSFYLTFILIIPFLFQQSNLFSYIHIFLSNYDFYYYKTHINSSLYMAFSITFLSWFAWIIPVCLISYLYINKSKLSLGSFISIMGACIFTLSIWSLHHFFATTIVNNSENIREINFNIILKNNTIHNKNIYSTVQSNLLISKLELCKVCHIFPNQDIDKKNINKLLTNNINSSLEFINLIPYNVRLVNIVKNNNIILYNLNRSSEVTFLSLSLYCIIFFPLFFFWLSLGIILQYAHKKYLKK